MGYNVIGLLCNSLSTHYFLSIVTYSWHVSHNEILLTSTNVKYLNFVGGTTSNYNYGFLDGLMFTIFHKCVIHYSSIEDVKKIEAQSFQLQYK